MATTGFDLVTPTATLFTGRAEMIVCTSVDGEVAFLAEHEPFIGALDPCVVRIVGPEGSSAESGATFGGPSGPEIRVAVHGGFVEVKDNHVIMLADIAQRPGEIDVEQARADESDAAGRAAAGGAGGRGSGGSGASGASGGSGAESDKAAETDLKWAQARIEVASSQ